MDPGHLPDRDRSMSAVVAAALGLCLLAGAVAVATIAAAPTRWTLLAAVAAIAIAACLTAAAIVRRRGAHPRRPPGGTASPASPTAATSAPNDRSE